MSACPPNRCALMLCGLQSAAPRPKSSPCAHSPGEGQSLLCEELTPESAARITRTENKQDQFSRIEAAANRIELATHELRGTAESLPGRIEMIIASWSDDNLGRLRQYFEASLEASVRRAVCEVCELQGAAGSIVPILDPNKIDVCADAAEDPAPAALGPKMSETLSAAAEDEDVHSSEKSVPILTDHPQCIWDFLPKREPFLQLRRFSDFVNAIEEPARSGHLAHLVYSSTFEGLCTSVIIFNAFFAAYEADHQIKNVRGEALGPTHAISVIGVCLLAFYVTELTLRICVHRCYFLCNSSWSWNVFDLFLVMQAVYDYMASFMFETSAGGVTFMRIFRLMKLAKIVRVVKVVRVFRELRMMLSAVRHSVSALLWAMVMLMFFLYVFSLIFVQGFTNYLADNIDTLEDHEIDHVYRHFGSVLTSVLTLFKAGLGGDDWSVYQEITNQIHWSYGMLFVFYIAFFSFTVTNILTGMIVENVVGLGARDEENVLLEFRRTRNAALADAEVLFRRIDKDGSGDISLEEFQQNSRSDEVMALMNSINLDVRDAELFFRMLAACTHEGTVNVKTFIEGVLKIRGTATSIDLQCLAFEVRIIRQMLAELHGQSMWGRTTPKKAKEKAKVNHAARSGPFVCPSDGVEIATRHMEALEDLMYMREADP